VVVGLVVILDRYHIDIKSILVTLGVGSLAIGLALQDTLANMFGGFTILVDRPFRVGDRIQLQSGEIGDVQTIGLRATTVLLPDQNLLIVPNALLVKNMVINHSYPDNRSRVVVEVGVAYGSDIELVKRLMLEAAQENPAVLQTPPPSIIFNAFGQSALLMTLTCNLQSYKDAATVKDDLNSMIDGKFRAAGIEIPFPSQTVYLRNQKQL
jgi:small-conductance mechanosensitive channel